jgi:CYTH domain-containing protein
MQNERGVMAVEIERKFLVRSEAWRGLVTHKASLRQAYPISVLDAEALVSLRLSGLIEKTRFTAPWHSHCREVDVFRGDN